MRVDGKSIIDTLSSRTSSLCPIRDAHATVVEKETCMCGAEVTLKQGLHSLSIEFADDCKDFKLDLRICKKVQAAQKPATKYRIRPKNANVCQSVYRYASIKTDKKAKLYFESCLMLTNMHLKALQIGAFLFKGYNSANGGQMKWECNSHASKLLGFNKLECVAGTVYCAHSTFFSSGQPALVEIQDCSLTNGESIFLRQNSAGQLQVQT